MPRYSEFEARIAIALSFSWAEALRRLGMRPAGGNGRTLQHYARDVWHIPTGHFDQNRRRRSTHRARPLSEILVEASTYNRGSLKRRLYAEGLKERRCELCGQDEVWFGRRMALILDHINGIGTDTASRTSESSVRTARRYSTRTAGATSPTRWSSWTASAAGGALSGGTGRSVLLTGVRDTLASHASAARPAARRVERPAYEQLVREVAESSYMAVGRKYGVSDNAIRKWLRAYEREPGVTPLPRAA